MNPNDPQEYFQGYQQQASQPQYTPAQNQYPPQVYNDPAPQQQPASPPKVFDRTAFERPKQTGLHDMVVLQPGEVVVATIKRHPFGIVSLYAAALVAIVGLATLVFFMPSFLSQFNVDPRILYGGLGFLVILLVLILGVATSVYWQNEWVVTTDSITQITQTSLFDRQVAQLSMDNLEDVTINQDGIIPHLFNFGTLKVETAGERSKFQFPYCPNPTYYARRILEIHEHFLEERRNVQNGS